MKSFDLKTYYGYVTMRFMRKSVILWFAKAMFVEYTTISLIDRTDRNTWYAYGWISLEDEKKWAVTLAEYETFWWDSKYLMKKENDPYEVGCERINE